MMQQNLKILEYDYCILREGYYDVSLKHHSEKLILFLDVDLVNSTYDCIKYLASNVVHLYLAMMLVILM